MSDLADQLRAFEEALPRRDRGAIPGGLASLIDDDFEEFGASGSRSSRAAVIAVLDHDPAADVAIASFAVGTLSDDVVLVTYESPTQAVGVPPRHATRASIWVRRDDRWRLRFHQGTPAVAGGPGQT